MTQMKRKVKKRSSKMTTMKVKKIARQVVNANTETHYIDTALASTTMDSAGTIVGPISLISQGDGDTNRSGDKVNVKSIQVRINLITSDATQIARVVLFQWIQNSGSVAPVPSDVVQNVGQPYSPLSPYTKDTAGYNVIPLAQKLVNLNTYNPSRTFTMKVSGKKLSKGKAVSTIGFNAGGTSGTGHYYLLFMSDSGAVAHPLYTYYARVRFVG